MPSSSSKATAAARHSDGRRGAGGGGYLIALDRPALIDGKFMARVQALADGALSFIPSVTRGAEQRTETPPSHIRRRRRSLLLLLCASFGNNARYEEELSATLAFFLRAELRKYSYYRYLCT